MSIQIASTSILSGSSFADFWLVIVAGAGGVTSSPLDSVSLVLANLAPFGLLADEGCDSGLDSWPSELEKLSDGVEGCEIEAAGVWIGGVAQTFSGVIGSMLIEGAGTNGYTKGISNAGSSKAISASGTVWVSGTVAILSGWSNEPYALGANILKKG